MIKLLNLFSSYLQKVHVKNCLQGDSLIDLPKNIDSIAVEQAHHLRTLALRNHEIAAIVTDFVNPQLDIVSEAETNHHARFYHHVFPGTVQEVAKTIGFCDVTQKPLCLYHRLLFLLAIKLVLDFSFSFDSYQL